MKRILKGQSIRIENHDRGSGREATWDKELHVHKVMDSDNFNGAEVLLPLNEEGDIIFRKIQGNNSKTKKRIKNEIRKSFKNKKIRKEFVEYVFQRIESYSQNTLSNRENIGYLMRGAEGLASHLGLRSQILDEALSIIQDKIRSMTTKHSDEDGNEIYIIQDIDGKNIRIGKNLDILNDWNKVKEVFNSKN